jgi:uncharacterized lipoprotein YmbA
VASILAAGCLGPRSDPSSFFLLSPMAAPTDAAAVPVVLGLGPIDIPGYLDRPQIVVRVSENEIDLAESDRWGEPLAENVMHTLRADLARLLPGSAYVAYPWYESAAPDYGIAVAIRRFEADLSGAVVLEAKWELTSAGEVVAGRDSRIDEAAAGPGRAAAVAAQSRALATLAAEIAAAVRRAHATGGAGAP